LAIVIDVIGSVFILSQTTYIFVILFLIILQ